MIDAATGLTLHVDGPSGAPVLFLHHGLYDAGDCWGDAVRRWSPRRRLVAVDARGHGCSPRFTPRQLAGDPGGVLVDDTLAILSGLAGTTGGPVAAYGHSLGGAVVAAAATRRPDLIRALVLEDPAWCVEDEPEALLRARALARVAWVGEVAADPRGAVRHERAEHPSWPEEEWEPWVDSKVHGDRAYGAGLRFTPDGDWRHVAEALAVPTLLVTGDAPGVLIDAARRAQITHLHNPHLRVAVVHGTGHCVRRDSAAAFHGIVDPWLQDHVPA